MMNKYRRSQERKKKGERGSKIGKCTSWELSPGLSMNDSWKLSVMTIILQAHELLGRKTLYTLADAFCPGVSRY